MEMDKPPPLNFQVGPVQVKNPNISSTKEDILYHLDLSTQANDLKSMFHDVKFVCFGGSAGRMKWFAEYLVQELDIKLPAEGLIDIALGADRFVLYKVGPVLSVSHGMGIPSISICFHEIFKLMYHAQCENVTFFRIGTSGGLGIEPGSVVITEEAVDGLLRPYMEVAVMGEIRKHPSRLSRELADDLLSFSSEKDGFSTIIGKTMCTDDFYEGQARLDGAFCEHTDREKMDFLHKIHSKGIRNIEMESLGFAAYSFRAGIKCAVVCVTLLNRLNGDQITASHEVLQEWQRRPAELVVRYIRRKLGLDKTKR